MTEDANFIGVTESTTPASVQAVGSTGAVTATRRRPSRPRAKKVSIPSPKNWPIVRVEWLDAVLHEGPQHSKDSNFSLPVRKSVGHLVQRSKEAITLAMEDDRSVDLDASDCDNATSIPIALITKLTILIPKE